MARHPIPTWCFALVVVRKGDRFLLVHERKHGQLWYLPAGRVEAGETFQAAAIRETLEESGVPIALGGVIRVEHTPVPDGSARSRVIFIASPTDDTRPKTTPDEHSLGAAWVSIGELDEYPLRGPETRELLEYAASGGPVFPLDLLATENAPYRPGAR
jgi:phosphatase NudJ